MSEARTPPKPDTTTTLEDAERARLEAERRAAKRRPMTLADLVTLAAIASLEP